MTREQKAERYDYLVREGDVIQRKMSRLQSQNAGISTQSEQYESELAGYRQQLGKLEYEMNKLFVD
jgi:predicted  nucleic acid-binding Zn-ribbon protein